jgi:hypothetical protein
MELFGKIVLWVVGFFVLFFLIACIASIRERFASWEYWRERALSWRFWLWPLVPPILTVDLAYWFVVTVVRLSEQLEEHIKAQIARLFSWRVARVALVVAHWWLLQPWNSSLWTRDLRVEFRSYPWFFLVVLVFVSWTAAALLSPLAQRIPARHRRGAFELAVLIVSVLFFIRTVQTVKPDPIEAIPLFVREMHWEQIWLVGQQLLGASAVAFGNALLLVVGPLWIFWKRPPPPESGPKWGDAQFADQKALRARGIIDER